MEIINIAAECASLGESPVWSAEESALYWVDINGCRLYRTDYPSLAIHSWDTPSEPGMIALRASGGLMVAMVDGIYAFDPNTEEWQHLVGLESYQPQNRPNDGKCDAAGRLWVGTMNMEDHMQPTGSFYRIDTDLRVEKIADDIRIPNGLAWSPDDALMYRTDTRSAMVWRYSFDAAAGTQVQHSLAGLKTRQGGGVAATGRGGDGFRGQTGKLSVGVKPHRTLGVRRAATSGIAATLGLDNGEFDDPLSPGPVSFADQPLDFFGI